MRRMTTALHTQPELAELPPRTVLAIDGSGAPEGPAFAAALAALLEALGTEDVVLEGTWWSGDDRFTFDHARPETWTWTLLVPVPEEDGVPFPSGSGVRVERRPAERVARLVHHGPYADEVPSLAALYEFVAAQGLTVTDAHTEAYLNDPRVVAPADLRTELRVPVR
jgi:hypothetical protein